jgi:ABC-type nitrate/sulfonate/bicarbonate transport system substrate-binding protein
VLARTIPIVHPFTHPLVRFAYADAGLNYYGNGIVATAATITSKPDLVHRFVEATIRGMKDAFADPADAGAIMHKLVLQVTRPSPRKRLKPQPNLRRFPASRWVKSTRRGSKPPST